MGSKEEIELFLKQLKEKLQFSATGIIYSRTDTKNQDALAYLDIIPADRDKIIQSLTYLNCFSGPKIDTYNVKIPNYFEFGIVVKHTEVYIKISLGLPNKAINCMSFHPAEYPINYPFKKSKDERKN